MEKVPCWRTKTAISLKCVKIEEKLLWTAYRNSPTLFRAVPSEHKILRKVAVGVVRESRKFSGHPYTGHIARSSL